MNGKLCLVCGKRAAAQTATNRSSRSLSIGRDAVSTLQFLVLEVGINDCLAGDMLRERGAGVFSES